MTKTLADLLHEKATLPFPIVVCLIGSTRFFHAYQEANLRETLAGKIVLTIGGDTKADHDSHCLLSTKRAWISCTFSRLSVPTRCWCSMWVGMGANRRGGN